MLHLKNSLHKGLALLLTCSFYLSQAQEQIPEWTHFRGTRLDGISRERLHVVTNWTSLIE